MTACSVPHLGAGSTTSPATRRRLRHLASGLAWQALLLGGAAAAALAAPPQPAQNYILEAMLGARYAQAPSNRYDFRPDGLETRGLSRFTQDVRFCLVGLRAADPVRTSIEDVLRDGVHALSAGQLDASFLPAPCFTFSPDTPRPISCDDLPPGQVTVFFGLGAAQGGACYGSEPSQAYSNQKERHGGIITGGVLHAGHAPTEPVSSAQAETIRHELGHVFGLGHTYGDTDMMSYRERGTTFAAHELEAAAVVYQLPPGLRLHDLIRLGVIDESAATIDEPPSIDGTWGLPEHNNLPRFVGQEVYVQGQRLTLAFLSERALTTLRPFGYAPPIVAFGDIQVVPDLRDACQRVPIAWQSGPPGFVKVRIPKGAAAPLTLTTRGQTAALSTFHLTGEPVPNAATTPQQPSGVTCTRQHASGTTRVAWTLPTEYADGTPLSAGTTRVRVLHNGEIVADLPGSATSFTDSTAYPEHLAHLYQVVVLHGGACDTSLCSFDSTTCEVGIPSAVCHVAPFGLPPSSLRGETFVVNSTADTADTQIDGTCAARVTPTTTACTLRAAIAEANATALDDAILFSLGAGTPRIEIGASTGRPLPEIVYPLRLLGQGAADRIFLDGAGLNGDGLWISGGLSTVRRLVISGFGGDGIRIGPSGGNSIDGCHIGTNTTATAARPNAGHGIAVRDASGNIIGGTLPNVISGNDEAGVYIAGTTAEQNVVRDNTIGANAAGTAAIANQDGVVLDDAPRNEIGGRAPNLISGNRGAGVLLRGAGATENEISVNRIGTNGLLTAALPNAKGIHASAAPANVLQSNLIAGNSAQGVQCTLAAGNRLTNNRIGLERTIGPLGNGGHGVHLQSCSESALHDNTIVGNGTTSGAGVYVAGGTGIELLGNIIADNAGLGIDLSPTGVNANDPGDADTGTNGLQNHAVLDTAVRAGTLAMVSGHLDARPITAHRIQLFESSQCDASGYGEGRTVRDEFVVMTDGDGHAQFARTFSRPSTAPAAFAATATAMYARTTETSEFSNCLVAVAGVVPTVTATAAASATAFPTLSPSPTATPPSSPTASPTASQSRTDTPTPTPSPSRTDTPSSTPTPSPTETSLVPSCLGDCDGAGEVTIGELLTLVNVALGLAEVQRCAAGDGNHDLAVSVGEIVQAVRHALLGCDGTADSPQMSQMMQPTGRALGADCGRGGTHMRRRSAATRVS